MCIIKYVIKIYIIDILQLYKFNIIIFQIILLYLMFKYLILSTFSQCYDLFSLLSLFVLSHSFRKNGKGMGIGIGIGIGNIIGYGTKIMGGGSNDCCMFKG